MTMTLTDVDEMLTTVDTCRLLHCSRSTLNRYVARGLLAPVRLSARKNLFRRVDLDALLAGQINSDATTIVAALTLMAEAHAEEERPLCPSCAKRRVSRGVGICTYCQQNQEAQLQHKRNWWDKTGSSQRTARRLASGDV